MLRSGHYCQQNDLLQSCSVRSSSQLNRRSCTANRSTGSGLMALRDCALTSGCFVAGGGRSMAAAPQLHHVFQLGRDVPVVHQFLRAVLVGHVTPARAAGVLLSHSNSLIVDSGHQNRRDTEQNQSPMEHYLFSSSCGQHTSQRSCLENAGCRSILYRCLVRSTPGGEAGGDGDAGGGELPVRVLPGPEGQHRSAAGLWAPRASPRICGA